MSTIAPPPPIPQSQVIATHSPQQPVQTSPQIREAVKSTHTNEKTNPDKKQKKPEKFDDIMKVDVNDCCD